MSGLFEYRKLLKKNNNLNDIRTYFKENPDKINIVDRKIHTPLISAIIANRLDVLLLLIDEFNAEDVSDGYGLKAEDIILEIDSTGVSQEEFQKILKFFKKKKFLENCK